MGCCGDRDGDAVLPGEKGAKQGRLLGKVSNIGFRLV